MITTDTGAKKIEGTDNWRQIFGAHNDTVDAYDANVAALQDALGIVVDGNQSAVAASTGQFIILKNSSIVDSGDVMLADGLYTATKAIPANTTIDKTYLTADANGGLNALNSKIVTVETTLSFNLSTSWVTGNPFNLPLPKASRVTLLIHNESMGDLGFLNLDIGGRCRLNPGTGVQGMSSGSSVIINGAYQTK